MIRQFRQAAIVAGFLIACSPTGSLCSSALSHTWIGYLQTSGRHSDVKVRDTLAYAATGWGLQIASISDPGNPTQIASLPIAGNAFLLEVDDGWAYLGVDNVGVVIVDCHDPSQPAIESCIGGELALAQFSFLGDMLLVDSVLYVAFQNSSTGLNIYNIADRSSPFLIQKYQFSASPDSLTQPYDLERRDSFLFVTDPFGVWIANIVDPAQPQFVGSYRSSTQASSIASAYGKNRLVSADDLFLTSFDLTALSSPVPTLSQFVIDSFGDAPRHLLSLDTAMLLSSYAYGVELLKVPDDPQLGLSRIGRLNTPGQAFATAILDSIVAIADGDGGMGVSILRGSELDSVGYLANGRNLERVTKIGRYIMARSERDVAIIDVGTPSLPILADSLDFINVWQLWVEHELLFATDQDALNSTTYLKVFALADTVHPVLLNEYEFPTGLGRSFAVRNGYSYHGDSKFTILSVANTDSIYPIGQVPGTFPGNGNVVLYGNTALASYGFYLYAIDISNPEAPNVMTPSGMPYPFTVAVIEDSLLFAIKSIPDVLRILNIADPQNPVELSVRPVPGATWLCKSGNSLIVSSGNSTVTVFDVTDPTAPQVDSTIATPGMPSGLVIDDSMLYVGDGFGLTVFRHAVTSSAESDNQPVPPDAFDLGASFPNPFNGAVTIPFRLTAPADVSLRIYNVLGRTVADVALGSLDRGTHYYQWDGKVGDDPTVPSGPMFYAVTVGHDTIVRKMMHVK